MQLKVMTYNIQGLAAAARADHLPRIAETIAAAAPDVVGLQEVHRRTRPAMMVDQAEVIARLTGYGLHFGKSCRMDGGDYGNAILTRGTIESAVVHPLPGSGEPRSLLQAEVSVDGNRFLFFVTHLAAWGRLLRHARLQQISTVGDITARGALPHVLAGDFNITPPSEEMTVLLTHSHLRICGDTMEPTFPQSRSRLDYIFCDSRFEFLGQQIIHRGPSDHWPLVVEVRLR